MVKRKSMGIEFIRIFTLNANTKGSISSFPKELQFEHDAFEKRLREWK